MLSLDRLSSMLAPHQCIGCGVDGYVLCAACTDLAINPVQPQCAGCSKLMDNFRVCISCRWLNMYSVTVCGEYNGMHGTLVKAFKFDLKRTAAAPMARIMTFAVPYIKEDFLVTYIPTAPKRIRSRGFDHGKLLAGAFCSELKKAGYEVQLSPLLGRSSNVRQLGASRATRIKQMKNEFVAVSTAEIKGKTILIIDDVMTTGASLSAAAATLKQSGAKRVYGLVLARKI